jgi:hypothetical protein
LGQRFRLQTRALPDPLDAAYALVILAFHGASCFRRRRLILAQNADLIQTGP